MGCAFHALSSWGQRVSVLDMNLLLKRTSLAAALGCMLLGCSGAAATPQDEREPVQEPSLQSPRSSDELPPLGGGETTSFTPTPCGAVSEPVEVDIDAAAALGFQAREAVEWLERGADTELHWIEQDRTRQFFGPTTSEVSGYDPDTRVHIDMHVTSLQHMLPSPKYCDGTTCQAHPDAEPVEQATCPTQLMIYFDVHVTTLDRAIDAKAKGTAMLLSELIATDLAELELNGDACSELEGKLELDDPTRTHSTMLYISLLLKRDGGMGSLQPTVVYPPRAVEVNLESLTPRQRFHFGGATPIRGYWTTL
jgi:hypothetical protein